MNSELEPAGRAPVGLCDKDLLEWRNLRGVVRKRWAGTQECLVALLEIKTRKLWRAEYASWELFCSVELGLGKRAVDARLYRATGRLLPGPVTATASSHDIEGAALQPNKTQAAAMSRLPPNDRAEVWSAAITAAERDNGVPPEVSPEDIAMHAAEQLPVSLPSDCPRIILNESVTLALRAQQKFILAQQQVMSLRAVMQSLSTQHGGQYFPIVDAIRHCTELWQDLKNYQPWAPCPYCEQGRRSPCKNCTVGGKQLGWVPRMVWERHTPRADRKLGGGRGG